MAAGMFTVYDHVIQEKKWGGCPAYCTSSNLHSSCASVMNLTMGCQQEGTPEPSLPQCKTPLSEPAGSFQPLKAMVSFYLLHRPTPTKSNDAEAVCLT